VRKARASSCSTGRSGRASTSRPLDEGATSCCACWAARDLGPRVFADHPRGSTRPNLLSGPIGVMSGGRDPGAVIRTSSRPGWPHEPRFAAGPSAPISAPSTPPAPLVAAAHRESTRRARGQGARAQVSKAGLDRIRPLCFRRHRPAPKVALPNRGCRQRWSSAPFPHVSAGGLWHSRHIGARISPRPSPRVGNRDCSSRSSVDSTIGSAGPGSRRCGGGRSIRPVAL